jgi:hypothetical protein
LNILIDTLALAKPNTAEGHYWGTQLPQLMSRLAGHNVFLLSRPGCGLNGTKGPFRILEIPNYELQHPVAEDRRLAALCTELNIDVFLSTLHTTAGGKVPSVLVAPEPEHNSRAIRLAWPRLQNPSTDDILAALLQAVNSQPDDETARTRDAEENALRLESERLRKDSLDEAEKLWQQAMRPVSPVKRVLRAVKNVHRYPEYFRRILQMR